MFWTGVLEIRILIREMEFWEHQWGCPRISHIGVCLKNAHILFRYLWSWENRYFRRWWNQAGFFVEVVDTNHWRHGYCLGLVVVRIDWKWSRRGGRCFLVSDEADRYFVSSPWSRALRLLLGKIFWNRVLDIIKRWPEFWRNQVWRRFADSD